MHDARRSISLLIVIQRAYLASERNVAMTLILIAALVSALILWSNWNMTAALDRLTASVTALETVNESAIALIVGLAEEIRNNVDDSDALNAIADKLDADAASMSAAVTANTPAAPEPTPQA